MVFQSIEQYEVPCSFTGEINTLSFNLGLEQVTPEERAAMAKTAAQARD